MTKMNEKQMAQFMNQLNFANYLYRCQEEYQSRMYQYCLYAQQQRLPPQPLQQQQQQQVSNESCFVSPRAAGTSTNTVDVTPYGQTIVSSTYPISNSQTNVSQGPPSSTYYYTTIPPHSSTIRFQHQESEFLTFTPSLISISTERIVEEQQLFPLGLSLDVDDLIQTLEYHLNHPSNNQNQPSYQTSDQNNSNHCDNKTPQNSKQSPSLITTSHSSNSSSSSSSNSKTNNNSNNSSSSPSPTTPTNRKRSRDTMIDYFEDKAARKRRRSYLTSMNSTDSTGSKERKVFTYYWKSNN